MKPVRKGGLLDLPRPKETLDQYVLRMDAKLGERARVAIAQRKQFRQWCRKERLAFR